MFDNMTAVWRLMHGSRLRFAMAITTMIVASCFLYMAPLVPQAVIDGVLVPDPEPSAMVIWTLWAMGGEEFVSQNLWFAAVTMIGLTTSAGFFTYLRQRWSAQASEEIICRLRDKVYDHLQRLPVSYFDTAATGDLVQRCTSDVETIRTFVSKHVVDIGRSLIMFFVPVPVMLAIDVRMTLASMLLLPFITAFSTLFFLRVKKQFEAADEAEGKLTTTIQENLTGIRVVRAFARQDYEIERFAERNQTHRTLDFRVYRLMAVFWSFSDLMTFVQQTIVVGAGVYLLSMGELTVGAFFYFLTAVGMFMYPLRQMGRIVTDLGKATVSMGRLREILDTPTEQDQLAEQMPEASGDIVFDNVTFAHGKEAPAVAEISLRIPARSTVAFVGASGAGKSTLIALLMRLYDPDSGEVRMDGRPLTTLDRQQLRRHLAVVMQQPFLFSKTLEQNLKLGRDEATREEVVEAAQMADVHETIARFDSGYDTKVGERGVTLSGGQRQRVALARALLQRPAVLVLDDALSAVDTRTETLILNRLRDRRGQQTTILIAHRLSTVSLADHIFVLDEGRLVQSGDHETLLQQPGAYQRLWQLQQHDGALAS